MSFRVILAPMFGIEADAAVLRSALGLARRFEAHVTALHVHPDPRDLVPLVGEGVSPAVIDQLTRASEEEIGRQRAAAKKVFDDECAKSGIAIAEKPPAPAPSSAAWRELVGEREQNVTLRARTSDLVVFPPADAGIAGTVRPSLETTLLDSGRPILALPHTPPDSLGHTVAVAWNGRAQAARAVAGAMPFLESARGVVVLTAETWRTSFDATLELAEYLEWHGIGCERRPVEVGDEAVGAAMLRTASAAGADLLVMGGYGRARLAESVLGGVTRHVLSHPELPVLMAH